MAERYDLNIFLTEKADWALGRYAWENNMFQCTGE